MKSLKLVFIILLFFSCGEDEVINTPPSTPTNISISTANFPEVEISWDSSIDPDNDAIVYKVYIYSCGSYATNNNVYYDCFGDPVDTYLVGETNSSTFYINNLEVLKGYAVVIIAVDAFGNESEVSEGRIIRTIHTATATGNIRIEDQVDVDFFEGHQIEILDGNVSVLGHFGSNYSYFNYNITDLSPLRGLKEIHGNLYIGGSDDNYNFNFDNLSGFEELRKIQGNLIFEGPHNMSLSNSLEAFSMLEEIGGEILIINSAFSNYCPLSDFFLENNFEITSNGFSPTLADFQAGNCSN